MMSYDFFFSVFELDASLVPEDWQFSQRAQYHTFNQFFQPQFYMVVSHIATGAVSLPFLFVKAACAYMMT